MQRVILAALFSAFLVVSPLAQVCNSMSGSLNCGAPSGFLPGVGEASDSGSRRAGNLPPLSTLGGDLAGGERPGTIGGITIGSGGRRCSGMFRSVNC
ncbi:MAG: hypothetical protein ABW151_11700 [Pseudorhodoplanes sp.]